MNEILVIVEFFSGVPEGWMPSLKDDESGIGLIGGSAWTALGDEGSGLGLIHFADEACASAHLRSRIESLPEGDPMPVVPSTVRHLRLEGRHGLRLEDTRVGGYLTLVHRLAGPGFGGEESDAVAESLEAIEPLEGYAGHLRGVNAALPDEVWAIVFWSVPPVLPHPPADDGLTVAHYRRVH